MVQKNDQYYLVPMQSPYEYFKDEGENESSYILRKMEIKIEPDEPTENLRSTSEEVYEDAKEEKLMLNLEKTMSDSENLNSYTCLLCQKDFKEHHNLKEHMRVHVTYPYECQICEQVRFKTEESFRTHMLLLHDNSKLFCCVDCDFKSTTAADIKHHQERQHDKIDGFTCSLCAKIFKNEEILLKHMEIHSTEFYNVRDQKDYDLTQLKHKYQDDKDDKDNKDNKDHKSYIKLYRNLNLLKRKKYFKCPHCKWCFRTVQLLDKHLKRHLLSFECDRCDAVFKYKGSFLKHKYKHERELII